MSESPPPSPDRPRRGILARPLDALIFLLPLMIFFEAVSLARPMDSAVQPNRVIAFHLVQQFFSLFGHFGVWAPAVAIVIILLTTHAASGEPWSIHWSHVAFMYTEAMALAIPLLVLNWTIPLMTSAGHTSSVLDTIALGIGAGVYEELIFRLVLISVVMMIGVDLLGYGRVWSAMVGIVLSAVVFAAHHHPPIGAEPFELHRFFFRTIAGVYLALIFWYRGYGPAAGCHAAYNIALVLFG